MIELTRDGDVFVVRMDAGENRFSPDMLDRLTDAYAEVAAADGPRAVVTTGTGKFFSNGLDLEWLDAHPDQLPSYIQRVNDLFAQVLALPCPTAAASNGHTFGAAAMLALAHDHRFMRVDRGFWCLPEVTLGMPFPRGMGELVAARLPSTTAHEAMVTSHRYPGDQALAAGIVEQAVPEDQVVPVAVERVRVLAANAGENLAGVRTRLHSSVMEALAPE